MKNRPDFQQNNARSVLFDFVGGLLFNISMTPSEKESQLKDLIGNYGSLAIAYSGGVDSTYLSDVAHEVLGQGCQLVLADSPSIPRSEVKDALNLAEERDWNLTVLKTEEFEKEEYLKNDANRCFFCKSELFNQMNDFAVKNNTKVLAYGAIEDDRSDHRPGAKAADDYKIVAPLQDVLLFKDEIRQLSKTRELPTWNKASFACLASRVPMGTRINKGIIDQIEQAEEVLRERGFYQYRVRHHDNLCRIEIDMKDLEMFLQHRVSIVESVKGVGYRYVTLDLSGYKTGSTSL